MCVVGTGYGEDLGLTFAKQDWIRSRKTRTQKNSSSCTPLIWTRDEQTIIFCDSDPILHF